MSRYTVEERCGCSLVFDSLGIQELPLNLLRKLSKQHGRSASMDLDLARMTGAVLVVGSPEGLAELKRIVAPSIAEQTKQKYPGLTEAAAVWLASGEQGLSSMAMFRHILGAADEPRDSRDRDAHPHDPDDLRRCRLLIEAVPEIAAGLHKVAQLSPEWASLLAQWDAICSLMDSEAGNWRNGGGVAPRTYEMMRAAIDSAGPAPPALA